MCLDQDDAEGLDGKVLLMREVPVHRNECVEDTPASDARFAVLDTIPTKPADGLSVMTAEYAGQVHRNVLVK
jgi:hypothetical protein